MNGTIIKLQRAEAMALSALFEQCHLPVIDNGHKYSRNCSQLDNGSVSQTQLDKAVASMSGAYEDALYGSYDDTVSPYSTLRQYLQDEGRESTISKDFSIEITG